MKTLAVAVLVASFATPAFADDITSSDIPPETKAEIKARCEAKWKDHQDRYSMTAFCIDQEVNAWAKVQNFR